MLFFQQKNVSLFFFFFISGSRSLSSFFSLSFAGLPPTFSFSLSFSCSIYQICGHDTLDNTDRETISAFVLIDTLVVSSLQDEGGYEISRQNNLELHLGCKYLLIELFQEPIKWSLHLPYKPLEPTLSRVYLFLERFPGETSRADGGKSQSQRRNDTAIVLHQTTGNSVLTGQTQS